MHIFMSFTEKDMLPTRLVVPTELIQINHVIDFGSIENHTIPCSLEGNPHLTSPSAVWLTRTLLMIQLSMPSSVSQYCAACSSDSASFTYEGPCRDSLDTEKRVRYTKW